MKIPAHLLSPAASNNKGAPNAPLQSVAEFLNEQSETPKDFLSAMKALQSLAKPQNANQHAIGADKGPAKHGNSSAVPNFAELNYAEPKMENSELQELDPDISQDIEQFIDSENGLGAKTVTVDRSVLPGGNISGVGLLKNATDSTDFQRQSNAGVDVTSEIGRETRQPTDTGKLANTMQSADSAPHSATTVAENIRIIERVFTGFESKERKSQPVADIPASIARSSRLAAPVEENVRRIDVLQLAPDRESLKSGNLAAKGEANSESLYSRSLQRAETAQEPKPTIDVASQSQIKGMAAPQLASTNMPTVQTAPLVTAKEISAQVTRHLNSEMLNMDLRTQVVSERTSTGALNTSTLTLQLHPIGLGRVQAEIRKDGDLVRIKLTVETSGTFEVLKNDIDALKAAMRALGTSEGDVTLTQGNITRLPNDAANEGQNPFSNDRDTQSELNGRQDQDANGHSKLQSGDEETATLNSVTDQTLQDGINTVFI